MAKNNKKIVKKPCWNKCKNIVNHSDGTDYVRICLENVFVTQNELEKMMQTDVCSFNIK